MTPRIDIEPLGARVRLAVDGTVLADSARALKLMEGDRPPVLYLPREDVAMDRLVPHPKRTHCPWKGEARHFGATLPGGDVAIAAWSYEAPIDAVSPIAGRIAFYTNALKARFEEV